MQRQGWALFAYALTIILLLLVLFVRDIEWRLIIGFLLTINLASLLVLLFRERDWDGTHYLALGLLILTGAFTILFLATPVTGISYLFGGALILASALLLILEIMAGEYPLLDKVLEGRSKKEAPQLEEIQPYEEPEQRLFTTGGSDKYHTEECRLLQQMKVADLIQLTGEEEAKAYGLKPCKICKP